MAKEPDKRPIDPELAEIEELGRIERRRALESRGSGRMVMVVVIAAAVCVLGLALVWAVRR